MVSPAFVSQVKEAALARIVVFPGDGIGPEVTGEALKALDAAARTYGLSLEFEELAIGGAALDAYGVPVRDEDIAAARDADAALLGAVGGPNWDAVEASIRPERACSRFARRSSSLPTCARSRPFPNSRQVRR